jgi:hypothetical protein
MLFKVYQLGRYILMRSLAQKKRNGRKRSPVHLMRQIYKYPPRLADIMHPLPGFNIIRRNAGTLTHFPYDPVHRSA